MAALAIIDPDYNEKLRFAAAYLRLNDPMKASMAVVSDAGRALQVADRWLIDPVVTGEMERLLGEKGPQAFLPAKEQILVDIKRRADACSDPDGYIKLMRLYSDMRNWTGSAATNVKVDVGVQTIMVVPMGASDAEWESNAGNSQRRLIDASRD